MPGAKKCHPALPALFFFLLLSPGPPGVESTRAETSQSRARDLQELPRDRRMLLQVEHKALQDRSRRQNEVEPDYTEPDMDNFIDTDFTPEHIEYFVEPIFTEPHIEYVRVPNIPALVQPGSIDHSGPKSKREFIMHSISDHDARYKFILFLTDSTRLSNDCKEQYRRIYTTTRDCTNSKYYRRCVQWLTRLSQHPICNFKRKTSG